jgi:hypothetical protein
MTQVTSRIVYSGMYFTYRSKLSLVRYSQNIYLIILSTSAELMPSYMSMSVIFICWGGGKKGKMDPRGVGFVVGVDEMNAIIFIFFLLE